MAKNTVAEFMHQVRQVQLTEAKTALHGPGSGRHFIYGPEQFSGTARTGNYICLGRDH